MDSQNTEYYVIEADEEVSKLTQMLNRVDFHLAIAGGGLGDVIID